MTSRSPTGRIRVTGREYNGLLESPCHQRGAMSCLSCHSMHKSDPNDQLARGMRSNQAYGAARTWPTTLLHAQNSASSNYYNCTCRARRTGCSKRSAMRCGVHDVATTLKTGRPNACNITRTSVEPYDWTAEHLAKRTGKPKVEMPADHQNTAASAVWLLNGDAGQRALAAWHMGWEPAMIASGSGWQSPRCWPTRSPTPTPPFATSHIRRW